MRKIILEICFVISSLAAVFGIALIISALIGDNLLYNYWMDGKFKTYQYPLNIIIIGFWIFLIVIWNRHDKKASRLVLLILLNIYYMPFYYRIADKNQWTKQKNKNVP